MRLLLVVAAGLAVGLAGCVTPLERGHGYPVAWPDPLVLSKGFPEIDGKYANHGTMFSPGAGFSEITLTSLIPEQWTFGKTRGGDPVPNPPCTDCVVLRVRADGKWSPFPKLQATIPGVDRARGFDIELFSDDLRLDYSLRRSGSGMGFFAGSHQTAVSLTVAADRSLLAQIRKEDVALIVVVPYYSAEYSWARFARIGD